MDLYREMPIRALENEKMEISFPSLHMDASQIAEGVCYAMIADM